MASNDNDALLNLLYEIRDSNGNLRLPQSRVEALLHEIINGGTGGVSGMTASEIRHYLDEKFAESQGQSAETIRDLQELKQWVDENSSEMQELLAGAPYAKIVYVEELPEPGEADPNTIYMLRTGSGSSIDPYKYLKYRFVEELPNGEDADPDAIYFLIDSEGGE